MSIMIEQTILSCLADALDVPVYMEVPAALPETFVTVEKTGSSRHWRVDHATFAVQSWAGSKAEAAALNGRVKAALDAFGETSGSVGACRLNSDYDFTDAATKRYRYQAVYDVTY